MARTPQAPSRAARGRGGHGEVPAAARLCAASPQKPGRPRAGPGPGNAQLPPPLWRATPLAAARTPAAPPAIPPAATRPIAPY